MTAPDQRAQGLKVQRGKLEPRETDRGVLLPVKIVPGASRSKVAGVLDGMKPCWRSMLNDNGIPDECDCRADYTGDKMISAADLARLLSAWGKPTPKEGDLDADGEVGAADLAILLSDWGECQ